MARRAALYSISLFELNSSVSYCVMVATRNTMAITIPRASGLINAKTNLLRKMRCKCTYTGFLYYWTPALFKSRPKRPLSRNISLKASISF